MSAKPTPAQRRIIEALKAGAALRRYADYFYISGSDGGGVSSTARVMERNGWIEPERCGLSRRYILTDAGWRV